jgi:hypothetical protein
VTAAEDYLPPTRILNEAHYLELTSARVTCWHLHVSAKRTFLDKADTQPEDVAVFLEDDVDMEKDIAHRLSEL